MIYMLVTDRKTYFKASATRPYQLELTNTIKQVYNKKWPEKRKVKFKEK